MSRLLVVVALFVLILTAYQAFGQPEPITLDAPGVAVEPKACISSQAFEEMDACYSDGSARAQDGHRPRDGVVIVEPVQLRERSCPWEFDDPVRDASIPPISRFLDVPTSSLCLWDVPPDHLP